MQTEHYFGDYVRFETVSKKDASVLLGADTLVGDPFEIVFQASKGTNIAWLKNRFGALIGYFEPDFSRKLNIMKLSGWHLKAILSFIAFTDRPEPGHYWGQVALISYDPHLDDVITPFIKTVSAHLKEGIRLDINLSKLDLNNLIESEGKWKPDTIIPLPKKITGTAIMKSRRTVSERLIEQGRKGNKGCYFVSWFFLLLIVALLVFAVKSCGFF